MKAFAVICTSLFAIWLTMGCDGQLGVGPGTDPTLSNDNNDNNNSTDPWAPCTDKASCCTQQDIVCTGDIDESPVCKCTTLWQCPTGKKCHQDKQVPPGGGTWSCTWSEQGYTCTGNPPQKPGGTGGWSCSYDGAKQLWVCKKSAPNPSNKPGGTAVWTCKVDNAANKILCERKETTTPPPPPPPPPAKKESNCGDGIDNDGDGKVDCKDEDCPACQPKPQPCPPGVECCDGKDNDGDGKIDEGNVCAGVGEPCPPGAFQSCDCYCGVHRKCQADGTWGPCKVDGNGTCALAKVTTQAQCPSGTYCDYGKCVYGFLYGKECKGHSDCPTGKVCDLGKCIKDTYKPCP